MDLLQAPGPSNTGGAPRYQFQFSPNGTSNPTNLVGQFIQSVTASGSGTSFLYLVQFTSQMLAIRGFGWGILSSAGGGPAQGFTFNLDGANTNLVATTPGAVIAIAPVNASGTRAPINADSPVSATTVFFEIDFSVNTTLW